MTGIPTPARSVDVDTLPAATAGHLRRLVEEARFFSLPASLRVQQPKPWDFEYELTIEDGGRVHKVVLHPAANPVLSRLIAALEELPE